MVSCRLEPILDDDYLSSEVLGVGINEEESVGSRKSSRPKVKIKLHKSSHLPMLLANDTVVYNTIHARKASSTENIPSLAVSKVKQVAKLGLEVTDVDAAPAVLDELAPVPDALDELPGATPPVLLVAGSAALSTNKACTTANAFICCPRRVSPTELAVVHLKPHWPFASHCLAAACADAVTLGRMSGLV